LRAAKAGERGGEGKKGERGGEGEGRKGEGKGRKGREGEGRKGREGRKGERGQEAKLVMCATFFSLQDEYKSILLNQRELTGEEMVAKIMDHVEQRLPPDMSADEKRQALYRGIMDKLNELSASLQIRLGPIAKSLMQFRQNRDMNELFAEVQLPELNLKEKSLLYGRMLFRLLDDPAYVSYATTNPKLLGKLAPKDVWFLTFFAFVTCKRTKGDNLLQLGCCGISSAGKSKLIESVLLTTAHQLLSSTSMSGGDAGVGR